MEELYQQNAELIYYYIYKQCHNHELAQEITQETFLRAIQSIERYDYSCKISVWLCSIAKHIYYHHLQKSSREILIEDIYLEEKPQKDVEEMVLNKIKLQEIITALKKFPQNTRRVMFLRAVGELSFKEIGEIMGKSENWARVTFYRGKEALGKEVRDED